VQKERKGAMTASKQSEKDVTLLRNIDREESSSLSSPRKSVDVGKMRATGTLGLRVRGRVMVRVCMSLELHSGCLMMNGQCIKKKLKVEGWGVGPSLLFN